MCDTGQQLDIIRAANAALYRTNSMDRFAHDFVEKCARWSSILDRLEVGIWLERPAEWFATSPEILHLERSASEPSPGVLSARTNRVVSVTETATNAAGTRTETVTVTVQRIPVAPSVATEPTISPATSLNTPTTKSMPAPISVTRCASRVLAAW